MSVTRYLIDTIGYFDTSFFNSEEHCDWTNRARLCGFIALDRRAQQCISLVTDTLESQKCESSLCHFDKAKLDNDGSAAMNEAVKRYGAEPLYRPFRLHNPKFAGGREGVGIPIKNLDGYTYVEDFAPANYLNE